MSYSENDAELQTAIANILSDHLDCLAGDDEAVVSTYNLSDSKNILTQWLIGCIFLLFILAMGNVISKMILINKQGDAAPLKYAMVYLFFCVFLPLSAADYLFAGVNNYPYMSVWATVMLFIPITLSAKYGFSNEFENEAITISEFGKYCGSGIRPAGLIVFVAFWAIAVGTGCGVQDTGEDSNGKMKPHIGLIVFLVFSCIGMAVPVSIILNGW